MAKKRRRTSKSKAVRNALGQLGWHASGKDVVALLASYGIDVGEGLVNKVRLENLKDTAGMKRQKARMRQAGRPSTLPLKQKVPPQRSYRR